MTDPLGNITTTLHDNMNRLTVRIDARQVTALRTHSTPTDAQLG